MSIDNTKRAAIATVDLGFTKIEGLMLPDGSYAIAVPQIAEVFSFLIHNASRDFKALLGEDSPFLKAKTPINSKAVNILTLEQFSRLVRALDKKGNPIAAAFVDATLEEALERRFNRAFEKRVSEDEYNVKIALRMQRLLARRLWTDVLRDRSLELYGVKPVSDQYKAWTVIVNERLFNRAHFFCVPLRGSLRDRDNMEQEEQELISLFESMAARKSKLHPMATPDQLVEMSLAAFE